MPNSNTQLGMPALSIGKPQKSTYETDKLISSELLSTLQSLFPPDRLFTDPVDCYAYAYDNSRNFRPPLAVVFSLNAETVQALVKLRDADKEPLALQGLGVRTVSYSVPEHGRIVLPAATPSAFHGPPWPARSPWRRRPWAFL